MPRYKKVADEQKNKGLKRKIAGIFMLLAGLLVAASDIGVTSSFWSEISAYLLGLGAFLVPLALIICGIYLLAFSGRFSISRRVAAFVLLLICFLGLAHHLFTPAGQELDLYSFPEGGGFIGGIILWTLRKIAGTAGALIILVVLGLASVLLLSRISLQLLFVKIKNSFSGISKRENKKDVRRNEYSQPVKQKNITVSKENTFNPYRDGEFSEFTEGLEKPGAFKRIFGKTKKSSISEHLVNYRSEAYEDDAYNAYLQDDEQKQENTTQATQAFFAAPEEFAAEKTAVKQESKPVLDKFVKPEQDMAPAGSFLNPYRQKAIDFSDEEIPSEKIFAKPETKDDFTLNKPLNIADSADLVKEKSEEQAAVKTEEGVEPSEKDSAPGYKFPPLSLLNMPTVTKDHNLEEGIRHQCGILEQTLSDFKVRASVVAVTRGPSVTRFELEPAPGVKVSSVVNLADDIALKLAAPGVRIEAPIPGKAAIGIEVPNLKNDTVFFKEVVDCEAVKNSSGKLAIGLGKDISGNIITADLSKMPHLLVAGSTGSGKSVCINTIIAGLLYKYSPDYVKLILVDPKVVELSNYNGIPHLLTPVVTDSKKAASALHWAVAEMERRYKAFAESHVRDISSFNEHAEEKMPFIVIIIDELADLMMVAKVDVEDAILRLAQKARAAGIHLILATQRPSVDVITGIVKANIPSRIAFAVSSQTDSRTILDMGGAEKLLGKGDMLFYPIGINKPVRVQGAFVSDDELNRVVDFIKEQAIPVEYSSEVTEQALESDKNAAGQTAGFDNERDELFEDAVRLVMDTGQASSSMLQRKFRIGYTRAARLVDCMEDLGIISHAAGSKPRELIMPKAVIEDKFFTTNN